MTLTVNIHDAKTHSSRLVEQAARGRGLVIAKTGRPVVRMVPIEPLRAVRTLGSWPAKVVSRPISRQHSRPTSMPCSRMPGDHTAAVLLDTPLLLWADVEPDGLSPRHGRFGTAV